MGVSFVDHKRREFEECSPPLTSIVEKNEYYGRQWVAAISILQKIFFCVQQKNEALTMAEFLFERELSL